MLTRELCVKRVIISQLLSVPWVDFDCFWGEMVGKTKGLEFPFGAKF